MQYYTGATAQTESRTSSCSDLCIKQSLRRNRPGVYGGMERSACNTSAPQVAAKATPSMILGFRISHIVDVARTLISKLQVSANPCFPRLAPVIHGFNRELMVLV